MPNQVAEIDYRAEFSAADYEKISNGLIPQGMEDRWFIYLEGNRLNIHRSWSGLCIYQVDLICEGDKYLCQKAIVNRAPDEIQDAHDFYNAELLAFVISEVLLDRDTSFP